MRSVFVPLHPDPPILTSPTPYSSPSAGPAPAAGRSPRSSASGRRRACSIAAAARRRSVSPPAGPRRARPAASPVAAAAGLILAGGSGRSARTAPARGNCRATGSPRPRCLPIQPRHLVGQRLGLLASPATRRAMKQHAGRAARPASRRELLAQRRRRDHVRAEPVVEVLAEPPGRHLRGQVAVGGGDDLARGTCASRVSPRRWNVPRLEHAQQLHLDGGSSSPISSRKTVPVRRADLQPAGAVLAARR